MVGDFELPAARAAALPAILDPRESCTIIIDRPLGTRAPGANAMVIQHQADECRRGSEQPGARNGPGAEAQPCGDQEQAAGAQACAADARIQPVESSK